jgi:hypothetical protein
MYLPPHVLLWCILGSHNLLCMLVCSHSYVAMKLTTCLHLAPRLRMCVCGPLPLCHTSQLHAVVPRHRDFTFTLIIVLVIKAWNYSGRETLPSVDFVISTGMQLGTLIVLFNLFVVYIRLTCPVTHYCTSLLIVDSSFSESLRKFSFYLSSKSLKFSRNLNFLQFI